MVPLIFQNEAGEESENTAKFGLKVKIQFLMISARVLHICI